MANFQWLLTFQKLFELKNFTRTADYLGITQAAVSLHIKKLEKEYGKLLIREAGMFDLTPAGAALLNYIGEVVSAEQRLQQRLADKDPGNAAVRVICPGSLGLRIYPILLDLQQQHPALQITCRFAPDDDILDGVRNNHFDIGFVGTRPDDARISSQLFCREPLELVVPASIEVLDWESLCQLGFIDHPDGKAMANRLLSRMYPGEFRYSQLRSAGFVNQISLILEPVARGLGCTVIPQFARQTYHEQRKLRVIDADTPISFPLWCIHRSEWPLSQAAEYALESVRDVLGISESVEAIA